MTKEGVEKLAEEMVSQRICAALFGDNEVELYLENGVVLTISGYSYDGGPLRIEIRTGGA